MGLTPPDWPTRPLRRRPRTLWSDLAGLWGRFRRLPVVLQLIVGAIAAIVLFSILSAPFRDDSGTRVAARSSTTVRTSLPSTTTTVALPAGDDRRVKSVIDGDSFEISDGTKIRLIGIDAPDVETSACFSSEATQYLRQLLEPERTVRVVYDASRTDRFGRTLAYVYRLPDGLFVNLAVARDGFAIQQTTAPNTAHADEIGAAVDDARNARRGLWQACQTTTTARPATTAVPATDPPATPTTTEPAAPETTEPSTTVPSTATTRVQAGGTVQSGGFCLVEGAQSSFSDGTPAVCDDFRWRAE